MSLINEALKKAQKQRTGDTPSLTAMPTIGGESAARIARRGKPQGFNTLLVWIGLGVAGVAVAIAATVMVMRRPSAPATVPPAAAPATTPATAAVAAPKPAEPVATVTTTPATPTAPVVAAPTVSSPAPAQTTVAATPPAASTTVIFVPAEKPKPAEVTPIQLAPAPEPTKPVVSGAPRKLEPRAINFINSIRVAGIRASANDSKVLMNDRVYRVGDIVEAEMGLKLTGITPNSLTFEDENGGRFTRTF